MTFRADIDALRVRIDELTELRRVRDELRAQRSTSAGRGVTIAGLLLLFFFCAMCFLSCRR